MPSDYAEALTEIKRRVQEERLRVVVAANSAMVLLYWDIGRTILEKQGRAGWGAKVVDRLAADLREAYPDMKGFAAAWPDKAIVQEPLARIPWYHNLALLEKLTRGEERLWYARKAAERGWSHSVLVLQIKARAHVRSGRTVNNFNATLPPAVSDMAGQVFPGGYCRGRSIVVTRSGARCLSPFHLRTPREPAPPFTC
jgi:DUF1016 N-terminal domain